MCVTLQRASGLFFREGAEKIFTRRVNIGVVVICWIIPLIFLIPSLTGSWGAFGLKDYTQSCTIIKDKHGKSPKFFFETMFVIIPVIVLIISNIMIIIKIKCVPNSQLMSDSKKEENLFIFTFLLIFILFLLAFPPKIIVEKKDKCFRRTSVHA